MFPIVYLLVLLIVPMFNNEAAFILIATGHLFYWYNLSVEVLDIENSISLRYAPFAQFLLLAVVGSID